MSSWIGLILLASMSILTYSNNKLSPLVRAASRLRSIEAPAKLLRYVWVIIGPAGCGKSTIAQFLASKLNLPYIEGDDFHPLQNTIKMAKGIPLTDEDRWGWLATLKNEAIARLVTGSVGGCIVTCSCLKREYRDVFRTAKLESGELVLRFVYLRGDEAMLLERVHTRKGHYMKAEMVHSQFVALEEPGRDETDVVTVDASGVRSGVQLLALEGVLKCMNAV